MTTQRYSLPAIALHWLHAALLIYLLYLGWTMTELPKGIERSAAYGIHKSLGLLALLLASLRLAWRLYRRPPPPLASGWEARLATAVHHALYLCFFMAPVSAYLASSFSTYPLKFFGLVVPKLGWPDEALQGVFKLGHQFFVWSILLLVCLHIAGALKHLMRRDGSVSRMLSIRGVQ